MARTQRSIEERISEKEIQYEQVMEKAKQYQAQMKRLKQQQKAEERKKRTHLLCQIGGTVEKVLDRPLVEEDVMRLLNFINQQERNGKYFTRAMEKCPDTGSEMEGAKNE